MIESAIKQIVIGQNLDYETTYKSMTEIMEGLATPVQISAFLTSLRIKGETVEEIFACAKAMRDKALKVSIDSDELVDTCGTGGDGANTFNISTTTMFVAAACGVKIAKHGNRSITSKCGAADVLEQLGININVDQKVIEKCINDLGIGFMFAQNHHSSTRYANPIRKELGFRTVFNILGPLSNPAGAKYHLLGVFDKRLVRTMAEVLQKLGTRHALVVHGDDGLDEITLTANTYVAELKEGKITEFVIDPRKYGFSLCKEEDLIGGLPDENAEILRNILQGKEGAKTDIVLINAGAAIYVGGKADSIETGINMAREAIKSGEPMKILNKIIDYTR
jgi:anthranilate phosphoribosyltransferase